MIAEIRGVLLDSLGLDADGDEFKSIEKFHEALALDSVALLTFVVALEKRFGISIEEEWLSLERLVDLPALAAYIGRRSENGS